MAVARVEPFLLAKNSVSASPIVITLDGRDVTGSEELDGWDPASTLVARCRFASSREALSAECGVGPQDVVAAVLQWQASGTRQRGAGPVQTLPEGPVDVELELPGAAIGGTLTLRPLVVLLRRITPRPPATAYLPGSVLWRGPTLRLYLEGSASRFPVDLVDFKNTQLPDAAGWYLDADLSDLSAPATTAMRLLVNRGNDRVLQAVTSASTPADQALASAIRADVARQLIATAVLTQGPDLGAETWPADSIGEMLVRLIGLTFPSSDLASLQQQAQLRMPDLDAQIQAVWLGETGR